jgi:ketosteroid isomerase-like protein
MSRENVETVRGSFEAWNRGDFDGWAGPAHPDVEWSSAIQREVEGDQAVYRGRAGLRGFWDDWHALWDVQIAWTEIRDLGERVLVLATFRAKGGASGVGLERAIGYVFDFEDGRVRRGSAYLDPAEALAAVGLSE